MKKDKKKGKLSWDKSELAEALKIDEKEVQNYFTDGRRISFILERRIASEIICGDIADSEGKYFDIVAPNGNKWEVRSITKGGIYFCPSYMVGSGRSFDEEGFLQKLDKIQGYVASDITQFPTVPFWVIPVETVRKWWQNGDLGKRSKISRKKALNLLKIEFP